MILVVGEKWKTIGTTKNQIIKTEYPSMLRFDFDSELFKIHQFDTLDK